MDLINMLVEEFQSMFYARHTRSGEIFMDTRIARQLNRKRVVGLFGTSLKDRQDTKDL